MNEETEEKTKFTQGCETLISMLTDHLLQGMPSRETVVSNLRMFADLLEDEINND